MKDLLLEMELSHSSDSAYYGQTIIEETEIMELDDYSFEESDDERTWLSYEV